MARGDEVQLRALARVVDEPVRKALAAGQAWRITESPINDPSLPARDQLQVLLEVAMERTAQDAKWGQQDHPLVDPVIAGQQKERGRIGMVLRMAEHYGVPSGCMAKNTTDARARRGEVAFADVATEEQSEFIEAATLGDLAAARREAVQAAAVWVQVIERIDRMAAEGLGAHLRSGVPQKLTEAFLRDPVAFPAQQSTPGEERPPVLEGLEQTEHFTAEAVQSAVELAEHLHREVCMQGEAFVDIGAVPRLVVIVATREAALGYLRLHPEDAGKELVVTGPQDIDRVRGRRGPAVIRWVVQGLLGDRAPELEEAVVVINAGVTLRDNPSDLGVGVLPVSTSDPSSRAETD